MDQINLLPDHILTEIFENLSPSMIKSCSLVCKRWDVIIGNSRELMGRFKLNLDNKQWIAFNEAKRMKRKHQTAIVRELSSASLDVLGRHKLQSLTMKNSTNTKLSTLMAALNSLPSLTLLKVNHVEFIDDISESSDVKKVPLNLKMLACAVEIIHIFDCSTVRVLKLYCGKPVDGNRKMLAIDFLKQQRNLEYFDLYGKRSSEFFTIPEIFDLTFSLEKFGHFQFSRPFLYYEAFIKFLALHKKTLASLKVNFCTEPKFGIELIHKYALENLMNLNHLDVGYFEEEDELLFDELPSATQVTRNIESLAVSALSTDMNENRRFFAMFPNLKHLDLEIIARNNTGLLHCISEMNPNVETLDIACLDDKTEQSLIVYFPKLKEFSLNDYCELNLSVFINRHSKTLQKLTLQAEAEDLTDLTTKEILNCPNLKYLNIHFRKPNFYIMAMFDEISSKTNAFTLKIPHLKKTFNFPDDKAIWDKEIQNVKDKISNYCAMQ